MGPHTPQLRGHEAVTVVQAEPARRRASGSATCWPAGDSYKRLTSRKRPSANTAARQPSHWATTASGPDLKSDSHASRGTGLAITGRERPDPIAVLRLL